MLERLDELLRAGPRQGGAAVLSDQAIEGLGWSPNDAREIMRALGFVPNGKPKAGEPMAWRQTRVRGPSEPRSAKPEQSPFAALAVLNPSPPRHRRAPRKRARA